MMVTNEPTHANMVVLELVFYQDLLSSILLSRCTVVNGDWLGNSRLG